MKFPVWMNNEDWNWNSEKREWKKSETEWNEDWAEMTKARKNERN